MRISENLTDPPERPHLLPQTHDHFRHSEARSFWAMIPYFRNQEETGFSSVAAVAMVVNAARASWTRSDVVVPLSQQDILTLAEDEEWRVGIATGVVTLAKLKEVLITIFRKLGLDSIEVKTVKVQEAPECRENFECALKLLDPSCDQFLISHFASGLVVGEGRVGHFAPVVSYSRKSDEVLLFDPDTGMHQPYWAPRERLFHAMLEDDPRGHPRGYLLLRRE